MRFIFILVTYFLSQKLINDSTSSIGNFFFAKLNLNSLADRELHIFLSTEHKRKVFNFEWDEIFGLLLDYIAHLSLFSLYHVAKLSAT